MTYASRRGFANRQQARAGLNAAPNMGRLQPSALVMGLIDRFFMSPDFPLDTWLATHETPKLRRAMAAMQAKLPELPAEA